MDIPCYSIRRPWISWASVRTRCPRGWLIVMPMGDEPTGLLHETAIQLAAPLQNYDQQTAEELVELAQQPPAE